MHQTDIAGKLVSIQVGQPRIVDSGSDDSWTTGFFKEPVQGPIRVLETHIVGDGQADTKHHGGHDKAILAYSADHCEFWQQELIQDLPCGGFGENLTVAGVDESSTCIGDSWCVGEVVLEVTQPRQPCWKLGRRWNRKDLPKLVVQNGRSGWYFRVIETGVIQAGDTIELIRRPHPSWTIVRASRVFYGSDKTAKRDLARLPELSTAWKNDLASSLRRDA